MLLFGLLSSPLISSALALEDDFTFDLEGYYRMRGYSFSNLYTDQEEPGRFVAQRLRLQPQINFQDNAKFVMMADVIDDVVWGDNQSLASTALFAGDPSNTGMNGGQSGINIKRAWMEFDVILGKMRVGRMESNWGMGLLANDGNGFDDAFGENHTGATFDRILFATKPIAVAQTIMGQKSSDIPFFMGYAFDRLVEDPLIQYKGYTCEPGIADGEPDFDTRCDSNADGLTDLDHGYTDESRTSDSRDSDWAFDNADDVTEHVFFGIYNGKKQPLFGSVGDLTAGLYAINRTQQETNSNVWIYDAYLRFLWKGLYIEGEYLTIRGQSSAIVLPGAYDPTSESSDPLSKEVNIVGYAARMGYVQQNWSAVLETGYASGDENVADGLFTGRPLSPDFNVGLIIYDQVLANASANTWGESAAALWSNGSVYNSRYIHPIIRYSPIPNWELIAGYVHVWPDRPDGAIIQCAEGDTIDGEPLDCAQYGATASDIGWEFDLALKARIHKHILFSLEGGIARVTDRIKLSNVGLNEEGAFSTLQTRFAYEF
jgi:hypothetical protein